MIRHQVLLGKHVVPSATSYPTDMEGRYGLFLNLRGTPV